MSYDPRQKVELQDEQEHLSSSLTSSEVDMGAYHIGTVYAKALLGVTEKEGKTAEVMVEFDALITQVIDKYPKFIEMLSSEMLPLSERRAKFDRVLASHLSPLLLHFLRVVLAHRRGRCLRAIHRAAHDQLEQMRGMVRVQMHSAVKFDDQLAQQISNELRQVLGAEPILERHVDPALIGGAVFRVGDTVFDGSIAAGLKRIRTQMIDRSVHEIQSRRDRFSTSAGN